jgi:hypothetical protein
MQKVSTRLQRHFKGTHLIHHLREACQWSRIWDAKLLAVLLPNPRPERWGPRHLARCAELPINARSIRWAMGGCCRSCVGKERLKWRELLRKGQYLLGVLRPQAHSLGPDSLLEVVLEHLRPWPGLLAVLRRLISVAQSEVKS